MICETYVQFFKSLADPTRLEIIKELRTGPQSVSTLGKKLKFEQSRLSHNLRKLKDLGFVTAIQQGKQRIYEIDQKIISPLLKLIDGHVDTYYKHYCKCVGKAKKERWGKK